MPQGTVSGVPPLEAVTLEGARLTDASSTHLHIGLILVIVTIVHGWFKSCLVYFHKEVHIKMGQLGKSIHWKNCGVIFTFHIRSTSKDNVFSCVCLLSRDVHHMLQYQTPPFLP